MLAVPAGLTVARCCVLRDRAHCRTEKRGATHNSATAPERYMPTLISGRVFSPVTRMRSVAAMVDLISYALSLAASTKVHLLLPALGRVRRSIWCRLHIVINSMTQVDIIAPSIPIDCIACRSGG